MQKIVLDFNALSFFQSRYPRTPVRVLQAEAREAIASLLDDASRLNLGRDTQTQLTEALSYLDQNQNAGRTAYEHARSVLFRALQEKNPPMWEVSKLPDGGFKTLDPAPEVLHVQPSFGPKKRSVAVLDASITSDEIEYAKRRLDGCPEGSEFDHIRFAALIPIVRKLIAVGNGRGAISIFLRLQGFDELISEKLSKSTVAKIKGQIAREDAMACTVALTHGSTGTEGVGATMM